MNIACAANMNAIRHDAGNPQWEENGAVRVMVALSRQAIKEETPKGELEGRNLQLREWL
jgi:hypothetical protein